MPETAPSVDGLLAVLSPTEQEQCRLDVDHTPTLVQVDGVTLDTPRHAFPGV